MGRKVLAALIAACTCCSATSMFCSRLNCRVMTEQPKELVEVIWLSPGICPNCRSSGAVIDDAITSGAAAGIEGHHLNRRIVNLRQRGDRQLLVGHDAHEQQRHQQRGGDRPHNERPGHTHDCDPMASDPCAP